MKGAKKQETSPDVYMPNPHFKDFLKKRLHHEEIYQRKKHAGVNLTEGEQRERDALHRMKNHYLDKCVFPSMANVVTLLEYCMHPPLYEVFEDDIEELLLGIEKKRYDENLDDYSKYENQTVFARFLVAALSWSQNMYPNSFRLKLFTIMQRVMAFRILGMAPKILGNGMTESVLKADLMRVMALIEFLGRGIKIKTDMPDRPVKF